MEEFVFGDARANSRHDEEKIRERLRQIFRRLAKETEQRQKKKKKKKPELHTSLYPETTRGNDGHQPGRPGVVQQRTGWRCPVYYCSYYHPPVPRRVWTVVKRKSWIGHMYSARPLERVSIVEAGGWRQETSG
jgi:hypothetical protein